MIPVTIPSPGGACFGIYGPAPGPAVLMCPAFGDEALKTTRVWRNLAAELGQRGLATLRVDLPGTGNAPGAATDPDRVETWRAALRACVAWLASRHDGRVILFGYRFGALMALDLLSTVRAERLVLLDPPASGAALARYFRARSRIERTGPLPEGPDYIQVGGAPVSAQTLAGIATLPAPFAGPGLPPALLVVHDTPSSTSPWPNRLHEAGAAVETIPFEGHDEFVPHNAFAAKVPLAVLGRVVAYLTGGTAPITRPSVPPPPQAAKIEAGGCTETPIRFGPDGSLFGILCQPHARSDHAPALLLPTMGLDPSSGMSRMWTELARRVARQGITSLRFDLGGVGESQGELGDNATVASYRAERFADIRSAVDAMAASGFDTVRIVGYCSGAYAAWHAATTDDRIEGLLVSNLMYLNLQPTLSVDVLGLPPGTGRFGLPRGTLAKVISRDKIAVLRRLKEDIRRFVPPVIRNLRGRSSDPKATRRHIGTLITRRCAVSIVMAQDDDGLLRLSHAYGEPPKLPTGAELTIIPGADHLFTDRRHREQFLDLAAGFALRPYNPRLVTAAPSKPARILETVS